MEGDGVVEGDVGVERQVKEGRATAGDEEEDEGVFAGSFEHGQGGAGGGEGFLVGHWVAALEVAKAPGAVRGKLVGAADAAQSVAALHAVEKHIEHGCGYLAQGDDDNLFVAVEIDGVGTAAVGEKAMEVVDRKRVV